MSQGDSDKPTNAPTPESHQANPGRPSPDPTDQSEPTEETEKTAERENSPDAPANDRPAEKPDADGADDEPDSPDLDQQVPIQQDIEKDVSRLQGAIEAILLASDSPVSRSALQETFEDYDAGTINRTLDRLQLEYSGTSRGIHLTSVAGGYEFRTNPAFHDEILEHVEANPVNLSRAAMETLAIIAYRQPVTRAKIEDVRGVNSSGVIRTLIDYSLARVVGQLDDLGQPHVYGTTRRFLEVFGLDDLTDLPTLSEEEHEALQEHFQEELARFDDEF